MQHTNASKTARLPSLIETIGQGFELVNRHLWMLLVPLVLDLSYWLSPVLSISGVLSRLQAFVAAQPQVLAEPGLEVLPADLRQYGLTNTQYGLLNFVRPVLPSLAEPPAPLLGLSWALDGALPLLGSFLLINLLVVVASTLYLIPLADRVRGVERVRLTAGRFAKTLGSFAAIVAVVVGVVLLSILPFAIAAALAATLSVELSLLVIFLWIVLFYWLGFTTAFSFDAVVLSDVGPLRALLTSLFIIQRSFWSSIGLLILGQLILAGMRLVWQPFTANTIGVLVAIVGSAYITTGLAAAHLIFYRDRLSRVVRRPQQAGVYNKGN
jgi:hypothetical protein